MLHATNYNPEELAREDEEALPQLSPDQAAAFQKITTLIANEKGHHIFLDAPRGSGNTFVINLLLAKVCSE